MNAQATFKHDAPPVLELENVSIAYDGKPVVHNVSFSIHAGEVLALVGESGSGKTTTAQAIIGLLAENGHIDQGEIRLNGTDISQWSQRRLDALRGARISLIPQDPTSSLDPVKTIGSQVAEILDIHQRLPRKQRDERVVELLTRVGLTHPEQRAKQYPHELSGGMKQRVLIAIAIALQPALIIADEPTSALDVTVQKRILDLIDDLRREFGTAVLLVTHDLAIAAERADRLLVFRHGKVQEQGITAGVLSAPKSDYTRQLFADVPALSGRHRAQSKASTEPVLVVEGVTHDFTLGGKNHAAFRAVDNVSFSIPRGTTHSLVGESGSGKTTLARILLGFQKPDKGRVLIDGEDITRLKGEPLRQLRKKIQLVYQNPFASLDPSQTLFSVIEEPLLNFEKIPSAERRQRVLDIARRVALPEELLSRKPRELSGGQRQRVAIARALILEPKVLILDEATSALDTESERAIQSALDELQKNRTSLVIAHRLSTIEKADEIVVVEDGYIVERGSHTDLLAHQGVYAQLHKMQFGA